MTTLATVGYGDVYPVTPLGKLIACLTMCMSIFTIALPTSGNHLFHPSDWIQFYG